MKFFSNQTTSSFVDYAWLILYQSNFIDDFEIAKTVQTDLQQVHEIKLSSRIYVADVFRNQNETELKLFEIYRKWEKGEIVVSRIDQSKSNKSKFGKNDKSFIWDRRKDLTGVHLRVLVTPYSPYIIFENEVS